MKAQKRNKIHRSKAVRTNQQGFTLVELIITISLVALFAIYAQAQIVKQSQEVLAQGSGTYLQQVSAAAEQHALTNFELLSNGNDVPSTAVDLRPTVAELVTEGLLNGGFPSGAAAMPTRQGVRIDILKTGCPGASCQLLTLVCTTTPVTLGSADVRFDLAQTMVDQQGGIGGQALQNAGGVIRGPVLNVANPLGNVPGTVCGSSNVNGSLFNQFVRIRDTRDPDLQGNLSVAGNTTLAGPTTINNNLKTAGSINVNNCVRMENNGLAGFNCIPANNLPAGWGGGVRAFDVVASGSFLTSQNPTTFTGVGGPGQWSIIGPNGAGSEQQIATSGAVLANRLYPTGNYAPGSACNESGAITRSSSVAGLLVCSGTIWTPLATVASAGASCPVAGQGAFDPSGRQLFCFNGSWTLMSDFLPQAVDGGSCSVPGMVGYLGTPGIKTSYLCRSNPANGGTRWNRMQDVTTNLVFVTSYEVANGTVVGKPSCANSGSSSATAIPQLLAKTESTSDGGFARFVTDNGSSWTVQLLNGSGAALSAAPNAVATLHVYCYFP